MPDTFPSRDDLAESYLAQLPYEPYPVQEEALLTYFTTEQGVLVCAPTGMGKTMIAEAAMFEALHTAKTAYYTTPLIALTEQKFAEMRENAVRWGFSADDVGLVTGNRRVNPDAKILVVVAEILLNRLLNRDGFDFDDVAVVVMDEFHNFNDRERGIVWELTLGLLPKHVRLLLLSATVGNSREFRDWLKRCHGRNIQLVESKERRIPLTYQWVGDALLNEQIAKMAEGDEESRTTPALLFCFNRDECWSVAEQLKGRTLVDEVNRAILMEEVNAMDWSRGAGSKLKQMLIRGVGVHHAGMLPKYRRIVEDLYGRKLLAVCVCTETLAAGINLPARSVVLTTLMKGPWGKKRLIEASSAHQIFGRAGRPQFDDRGYVFALAHEDDVRILRWKEKFDQIPENTKDPGLLKAKKKMKKKRPKRRETEQYWTEPQFEKLQISLPAKLESRGPLPWRLLGFMLKQSAEVEPIRRLVGKRLLDAKGIEQGEQELSRMLISLHRGGFVKLEPEPPQIGEKTEQQKPPEKKSTRQPTGALGLTLGQAMQPSDKHEQTPETETQRVIYMPELARAQEKLDALLGFKSVNPLYGSFLADQLGIANREERIQALESVLELPRPLLKKVRVPPQEELPPGPLARERLDTELIRRGLIAAPLGESDDDDHHSRVDDHDAKYPPTLAEKLRLLFDAKYGHVHGVKTQPVWAAGKLLEFNGDFDKYIKAIDLVKQEGIVFRHFLRLILLCAEFALVSPPDVDAAEWQEELRELADRLTETCRDIDPQSTEKTIEQIQAGDALTGQARGT